MQTLCGTPGGCSEVLHRGGQLGPSGEQHSHLLHQGSHPCERVFVCVCACVCVRACVGVCVGVCRGVGRCFVAGGLTWPMNWWVCMFAGKARSV